MFTSSIAKAVARAGQQEALLITSKDTHNSIKDHGCKAKASQA